MQLGARHEAQCDESRCETAGNMQMESAKNPQQFVRMLPCDSNKNILMEEQTNMHHDGIFESICH